MLESDSMIWKTRYDYIVSASFGYLIPKKLIEHSDCSLNMHPSLLPKYRGSSPIQHTLYNKETETGVSIITLDPIKFDKGLILKQEKLENSIENETYASLSEKLAYLGGKLLGDVILNYKDCLNNAKIQDENKVIVAYKLNKEFSKLDFEKAEEIYTRFRSVYGTSMTPHVFFQGKRVNIYDMRKVTEQESLILSKNYPKASPGSLWLIYPGIGKRQLSTKFLKNINPVTYLKTSDGWIGILDFLIAGETHTKNTLKDFVYTYFDIEAYTKLQDMTNDTGELLRFT